jgi:hypothetical protein
VEDGRWGGAGGNWKEQLNSVHCLSVFFFFWTVNRRKVRLAGQGRGEECVRSFG